MKNLKSEIFYQTEISIRGHVLSWADHTVKLAYISRLWVGTVPGKGFLLRKSRHMDHFGMHLALYSGHCYSFIWDDMDFVKEVYVFISDILSEEEYHNEYLISYQGTGTKISSLKRTDEQEETDTSEKQAPAEKFGNIKGQLGLELQQLYTSWEIKIAENTISQDMELHAAETITATDDNDPEVLLQLIGQAIMQAEDEDRAGLKVSFGRFIEIGLINECNRLGLNLLLQKIKEYVF